MLCIYDTPAMPCEWQSGRFVMEFPDMLHLLLLVLLCFLLPHASSLPLCTDSRAPFTPEGNSSFCGYVGRTCCSSKEDSAIEKRFKSMNISNAACSSLIKSIICTECDPFSGDLFTVESKIRTVPILCNSTVSGSTTQSKDSTKDFCAQVWDTCKDVEIQNSPFAPSLQGSAQVSVGSSSKLTDLWQSKDDFCNAFGISSGNRSVCFDGQTILINSTQNPPLPKGLCLERILNESGVYTNFIPHPDGSNHVFVSRVDGKIWLANIPEEGSGGTMMLDETNIFLDLTDQVYNRLPLGMMGLAFHPDFTSNGRFFVSFNCDQNQPGSCSGKCSCNAGVGCDPSKLVPDEGSQPCQFHSVVAEFTANGTSSDPSKAAHANPIEVRRIFTMGLPFFSGSHGGQLLFGPTDGYLYFMMGDGGDQGASYGFAQNKKSLLGKIMRLDIDNIPSSKQITEFGLWGNYSVPKDNPYVDDGQLGPEIWALGLRNPWRCNFDLERPSYLFCADTGKDTYEEVDLITKGGNYGWNIYEGPLRFSSASRNSTPANLIFPIMGYKHITQSASIIGGYVYRSRTDPCMFGRYLYADLYGTSMWTGTENPPNSGNYTSELISFRCASNSPIKCDSVADTPLPNVGYIYSFGEDNNRDVYILADKGIYRIVRPSSCNYTCPIENPPIVRNPAPGSAPSSAPSMQISRLTFGMLLLLLLALSFLS